MWPGDQWVVLAVIFRAGGSWAIGLGSKGASGPSNTARLRSNLGSRTVAIACSSVTFPAAGIPRAYGTAVNRSNSDAVAPEAVGIFDSTLRYPGIESGIV